MLAKVSGLTNYILKNFICSRVSEFEFLLKKLKNGHCAAGFEMANGIFLSM